MKLEKARKHVFAITNQVQDFDGVKSSKRFKKLEETLLYQLDVLHELETEDNSKEDEIKKTALETVNICLQIMDLSPTNHEEHPYCSKEKSSVAASTSSNPSTEDVSKLEPNLEEVTNKMKTKQTNKKAVCAVAECENPPNITYHEFPKDKQQQKIWIQKCKRDIKKGAYLNPKTARICSNHFKKHDYKPNLTRKILKLGAIPSVFPGRKQPQHTEVFDNDLLQKIITKKSSVVPPDATPPQVPTPNVQTNPCIVPGCKRPKNVSLHVFPPEPRESLWLQRLQMDNLLKADGTKRKNAKVCSCHFVEDDYEMITTSTGSTIRKLKKDALPSKNIELNTSIPLFPQAEELPEEIQVSETTEEVQVNEEEFESPRDERHHARNQKITNQVLIEEAVKEEEPKTKDNETQYR